TSPPSRPGSCTTPSSDGRTATTRTPGAPPPPSPTPVGVDPSNIPNRTVGPSPTRSATGWANDDPVRSDRPHGGTRAGLAPRTASRQPRPRPHAHRLRRHDPRHHGAPPPESLL